MRLQGGVFLCGVAASDRKTVSACVSPGNGMDGWMDDLCRTYACASSTRPKPVMALEIHVMTVEVAAICEMADHRCLRCASTCTLVRLLRRLVVDFGSSKQLWRI